MIQRHSSRLSDLRQFLPQALQGAQRYDRIAGYFRSSVLEVIGEAVETMAPDAVIRIVCNADLDPDDVHTARAAQQAMLREWKAGLPSIITPPFQGRLLLLYELLRSGRMQVRVMPDHLYGFLHGKAGVVYQPDGSRQAFIGSVNETQRAWSQNYEIVWADASSEGCDWVQTEFEYLWNHPFAVPLAETVVTDIGRVAQRSVQVDLPAWRSDNNAEAMAAIELPVYLRENGLWSHQKWFVHHAFQQHRQHGARLVLADQVGLGKTLQVALAAKLMLLQDDGNVLVVVPKPLMQQWRDELWDLLQLPSATWHGGYWEDERGVRHPSARSDHEGLVECPRRLGIVSGGLVKQSARVREILTNRTWICVIVDEAHHARRKNTGKSKRHQAALPNKMLTFITAVAAKTKSMLLATATPVQIDLIEAYDLLDALNTGNQRVLGSVFSRWQVEHRLGLEMIAGEADAPTDGSEIWQWMRDPFPEEWDVVGTNRADTNRQRRLLAELRESLGGETTSHYGGDALGNLTLSQRKRLYAPLAERYFEHMNPYISHIVRRRREFLEEAINPHTHEPYLPKVEVELHGDDAPIDTPYELKEAFARAEEFCREVGTRPGMNAGFLQTLLLRRVGSSIESGLSTAKRMLGGDEETDEDDVDALLNDDQPTSKLQPLTTTESTLLRAFVQQLEQVQRDPKYDLVLSILRNGVRDGASHTGPWLELGSIIFSQYFDSAWSLGTLLTERIPGSPIALYAGGGRSGIWQNGQFEGIDREVIKQEVRAGNIRLVIGTDAASEGLNLQRLGTLINLDLPWNPTRLEQRKGRIQRIGQARSTVHVYNMRYRGSVEDKVHDRLSTRLASINGIFGQLPDTLEAVWISMAKNEVEEAERLIEDYSDQHPFIDKYDRIEDIDWESCSRVLDAQTQLNALMKGWDARPR